MSRPKVAFIFALGVAVGTAIAYFLYTEKGQQTIDDIKDKSSGFKDDINDSIDKGKHIIDEISSTAKSIIENINK
jgi:gas vesicle protein